MCDGMSFVAAHLRFWLVASTNCIAEARIKVGAKGRFHQAPRMAMFGCPNRLPTTNRWPGSAGIAGASGRCSRWRLPIPGRRSVHHSPLLSTHHKRVLLRLIRVSFLSNFPLLAVERSVLAQLMRPLLLGFEVVFCLRCPHTPSGCRLDSSQLSPSVPTTEAALSIEGMKAAFVDFGVGQSGRFLGSFQSGVGRHTSLVCATALAWTEGVAGELVNPVMCHKRVADERIGGLNHEPSSRQEARQQR